MLSLYKLEIFAAVVQAGSFSAAAQHLYMTQPAVSQHIQDLELSLGISLFIRGRRGVTLTSQGEKLHHYTERILQLVAEAESQVTNVENLESGQITIGATSGVSVYLLPNWINDFRSKYPKLNVSLQTGVTTQNVIGVMEHKLDIAIVEGELDKIQRKGLGNLTIRPVKMLVVVSPDHQWAQHDTIHINMLNDQPFITRQYNSRTRIWIDALLKKHGVNVNIVGEFDNQEAIKQAVISNMGLTIMPDYAIERECAANLLHPLTVDGIDLQRHIKILWDSNAPFTPLARALLVHLSEKFPSIQALLKT
ncbi:MAG: LysR family transcriptional regulator [Anaerolineae bacterium]|nr:LysR family transcriptional regulator [Anaerolineae bacterium]MDQ7036471.1 LysR family transcriptional regulator [Anaerolineae bacterium]